MKQIGYFLGLCGWVLGAIGGTGYALYCHAYLIGAAVVYLAALSFPKVREFFRKLTEGE